MAFLRDPIDRHFERFCATGDPGALGDVFDRTACRLLRIAVWLVGNRVDAEDLLQRTFLRAIETRDRFQRGAAALPWLMGLMGNEARRLRRERDRAAALRPAPDRIVDPEASVLANELAASVRSIGERLGAPYGDVLRLHLEGGLTCEEIARRLGRPAGSVRTQLMRGLELLRRCLPVGFASGLTLAVRAAPATAPSSVRTVVLAAARACGPIPMAAAPGLLFEGIVMKKLTVAALLLVSLGLGAFALGLHSPAGSSSSGPPPSTPEIAAVPQVRSSTPVGDERVLVVEPAPEQRAVELPRLPLLGALPDAAPTIVVSARGGSDDAAIVGEVVLLRVDRGAPWGAVTRLLEGLRGRGAKVVHFVAEDANAAIGCFTLTLPATATAGPVFGMRLHRERAGVMASSVVPVLARIVRGRRAIAPQLSSDVEEGEARFPPGFSLGVTAPADAPFGEVVPFLFAAHTAGVECALMMVDVEGPGTGEAGDPALGVPTVSHAGWLAVDLGPAPWIAVWSRQVPELQRGIVDAVVGFSVAPTAAAPVRRHAGAGGRYGGRGRDRRRDASEPAAPAPPDPFAAACAWFRHEQRGDGSFCDDSLQPDVEATALVMLTLLARGVSIHSGEDGVVLAKGLGWLMGQQADDGAFTASGPAGLRHHAVATLAVAEAYGLDMCLELRGALDDSLAWLLAQRQTDGGFASAVPGFDADVAATVAAVMAIGAAESFGVRPELQGKAVSGQAICAWFDRPRDADTTAMTAAELFARVFAGQPVGGKDESGGKGESGGKAGLAAAAGQVLQNADPADPWGVYWTTLALFQCGREPWTKWRERLDEIASRQVSGGALAGSWDPAGGCSRAVTTALHCLSLQATSRYARIVR